MIHGGCGAMRPDTITPDQEEAARAGLAAALDAGEAVLRAGGAALDDAECQTVRRALRDIGFKTVRFDERPDDEPPPPLPRSLSALL